MSGAAEFVLAGLPTVDLCRKYIKESREIWTSVMHANEEVSERFVRLNQHWTRLILQFNFFQKIYSLMEEEHRDAYEEAISYLQNKIEIVLRILRGLVEKNPGLNDPSRTVYTVKRAKYALKKHSLDAAIKDLEDWQSLCDQTWFLSMMIANPLIDNALKAQEHENNSGSLAEIIPSTRAIRGGLTDEVRSVASDSRKDVFARRKADLESMDITPIDFTQNMNVATNTHSDGTVTTYILNEIHCFPASKAHSFKANARDLVRKLQHDEPHTFNLLHCRGFACEDQIVNQNDAFPIILIFRNPWGRTRPQSLRAQLLNKGPKVSISVRLKIAKDIAKAVASVHTFGFVHKNIRPESVLVMDHTNAGEQLALLAGFDNFRKDEGWTLRRGDDTPVKNLYRHASRQGFNPSADYEMQHDIYSLGVCLLEVGLWSSFVHYDRDDGPSSISPALEISPKLTVAEMSNFLFTRGKEHLVLLAQTNLPSRMGDKYTKIVETCLTCLVEDNPDFGDRDEFTDEYGVRVAARYIGKVLLNLNLLNI